MENVWLFCLFVINLFELDVELIEIDYYEIEYCVVLVGY